MCYPHKQMPLHTKVLADEDMLKIRYEHNNAMPGQRILFTCACYGNPRDIGQFWIPSQRASNTY